MASFHFYRSSKHLFASIAGVTLLELIMIIAIVIATGSILIPKLIDFLHAQDLEFEGRKVKIKIRAVQQMAITEQTDCRIEFHPSSETYDIYRGASYVYTINLADNIDLDSTTFTNAGPDVVEFDPLGAPSEEGFIFLKDINSNEELSLSVTAITGHVTMNMQ